MRFFTFYVYLCKRTPQYTTLANYNQTHFDMKRFLRSTLALVVGLALAGCAKEYDDSAINKKVDDLAAQVKAYAEQVATYQSQVTALKTVVEAVQAGDYVTKVEQIEGGVTITFAKKGVVTIYNGAKGDPGDPGSPGTPGDPGAPGASPELSVKDFDGVMYWTVNGEKTVPVYQATPQFRVKDGKWEYSVDEGKTWVEAGPAAGGDSIFSKVEDGEEAVVFTLADGSTITIPKEQAFELVIGKDFVVESAETVSIPYTVKNATKNTVVDAFPGGAYKAVVKEAEDKASGTVEVTAPEKEKVEDGQVLVWADNGAGKTSIKKLAFEGAVFSVTPVDEVAAEGADIEVKVVSNLEFKVEPAVDWITYVETRAVKESTVVLKVAANTGAVRTGDVKILRADNDKLLQTISIAQKAAEVPPAGVVKVERVWGKFPTEWPTFSTNLDRTATMDEDYIYVAKSAGDTKGVWAIPLDGDLSKAKEVCMTGVESEGTFYTSCVRTIYDPAKGKHILLLSNMAMEGGVHLYLYAYENGIDAAPTKILSDYALPTWAERRFGDFFTVVGDWSKGYVWFRTNTSGASTTARFTIVNGKLSSQTPDGFSYGYGASQGKGSFYQYDMSAKQGLLVTDSIGMFYDLNSAEGQEWNAPATTENMRRLFGVTPFEFKGKKFIAFTKMKNDNAARSWIKVIEDKGSAADFKASLEEDKIVYQAALQINEEGESVNVMTGATYSNQTSANCAVVVKEDAVYIMGHHHNVGLSLFKLTIE